MDIDASVSLPDSDSLDRVEAVKSLPPGAHIHFAAICGTGMASAATLVKSLGYYVTGSDKAFYPPMGEVVKKVASEVFEGYSEKNLSKRPDLIVIGNNLSRGNPEVEYALEAKIPYASLSEVLSALLIGSRDFCATSIVVSGTHGKTTTTSAIALMLDKLGLEPGFFIGGVPKDLPASVRAPSQPASPEKRVVVLEGDEYDSAFFAKWPKFHSYRADIVVMTSLEFDHGDIYNNVEEIEREFTRLARSIPAGGLILICDEAPRLVELSRSWKEELEARVEYYGSSEDSKYRLISRKACPAEGKQQLTIEAEGRRFIVESLLSGPQNALNLLAATAIGFSFGFDPESIARALSQFHGVLRRQNILVEGNIALIEDFAHHPTAVRLTLEGIREMYPARRIVAVLEAHSNTNRRNFFQNDYPKSFDAADVVLLQFISEMPTYSSTRADIVPLDIDKIVTGLLEKGKDSKMLKGPREIESYLMQNSKPGDVIVCMSNGSFGGLVQNLQRNLIQLEKSLRQ